MILKNVLAAIVVATLLAPSGASVAAEYQPGDFLKLDLSKAVLSPKLLGPTTHFAPVPIEASSDLGKPATQARAEPKVSPEPDARKVRTARVHVESAARVHVEKRRGAERTKLAHRHTNPLDAQAFDRRIQVWPCKSGGICDWQR
jgi:hypothetical protein